MELEIPLGMRLTVAGVHPVLLSATNAEVGILEVWESGLDAQPARRGQ